MVRGVYESRSQKVAEQVGAAWSSLFIDRGFGAYISSLCPAF